MFDLQKLLDSEPVGYLFANVVAWETMTKLHAVLSRQANETAALQEYVEDQLIHPDTKKALDLRDAIVHGQWEAVLNNAAFGSTPKIYTASLKTGQQGEVGSTNLAKDRTAYGYLFKTLASKENVKCLNEWFRQQASKQIQEMSADEGPISEKRLRDICEQVSLPGHSAIRMECALRLAAQTFGKRGTRKHLDSLAQEMFGKNWLKKVHFNKALEFRKAIVHADMSKFPNLSKNDLSDGSHADKIEKAISNGHYLEGKKRLDEVTKEIRDEVRKKQIPR